MQVPFVHYHQKLFLYRLDQLNLNQNLAIVSKTKDKCLAE